MIQHHSLKLLAASVVTTSCNCAGLYLLADCPAYAHLVASLMREAGVTDAR
jgi:hypothetical protein